MHLSQGRSYRGRDFSNSSRSCILLSLGPLHRSEFFISRRTEGKLASGVGLLPPRPTVGIAIFS